MKYLVVIALLIIVFTDGALAAPPPTCNDSQLGQEMRGNIYRYKDQNILVLAGGIEYDSAKAVGPYIRNANAYQEVWMCSGGGSVHGGIEIGKALNRAKATVRTPNNYMCASACTIAAMGGYARIIDPNAQFVTHASSAFKSFGYKPIGKDSIQYSHFAFYDCDEYGMNEFCSDLRSLIKSTEFAKRYACSDPDEVKKTNTKCAYFDTQGQNYRDDAIIANALLTKVLWQSPELMAKAVQFQMRSSLKGESNLLEYFQTMLLDGRSDLVRRHEYSQLRSNFDPQNIYALPETDLYHRSLASDIEALEKASENTVQTFAVWQTILTDSELSLKTQISRYVKANRIELGPAGEDALKMYDAMRTCQIQSSCRLEAHTARALGYHNLYGYQ